MFALAVEKIIDQALLEDIGHGDITTESCIPIESVSDAVILAKSPGVVCGLDVAEMVFRRLDSNIAWHVDIPEGATVSGNRDILAKLSGPSRPLLSGERLALNLLQRMSGIATATQQYVRAVSGTKAAIVEIRKTTPGLRMLEKYAVTVGGGKNHRYGLYDAVLIKDNHIRACGSIFAAVGAVKRNVGHTTTIEVETTNIDEVEEALAAGVHTILLDNMSISMLTEAVRTISGRAIAEASGGINLSTVREIAETGVDIISVGALTHSVISMDISLDFKP